MLDSLYIGTVVGNADYAKDTTDQYLGRVLVKIPGLTVIDKNNMSYKTVGSNVGGSLDQGAVSKVEQFENIWAYVLAPIAGESAVGKYNRTKDASSLADGNDMGNFDNSLSYTTPPASQFSSQILDGYTQGPGGNITSGVNPHGNCYVTENYSNSGKGMFSIPSINSKVLIGFIHGSRGIPIVLGKISSESEIEQIYGFGASYPDYPGIFENTIAATTTPSTSATVTITTKAEVLTGAPSSTPSQTTSTTSTTTSTNATGTSSSTSTTTVETTSTIVYSQTPEERQRQLEGDARALARQREGQVIFKEYLAAGLTASEASRQTREDLS